MIPVLFLIVVVPSVLAIAYTFLFKPTLLIRYAAVLSGMGVQFMGARPSPVVSRASEHPEDLTGILVLLRIGGVVMVAWSVFAMTISVVAIGNE